MPPFTMRWSPRPAAALALLPVCVQDAVRGEFREVAKLLIEHGGKVGGRVGGALLGAYQGRRGR